VRHAEPGARVAHEIAGREVVGAVQHEVVVGDDVEGVRLVEAVGVLHDLRARADRAHRVGGRRGLGAADVRHPVHDLALQVGGVDDVVVDHADRAHAGGREVQQRRRAQPPGTHDQHPRGPQPSLPVAADVGQQQVPGVPRALRRRELGAGWHQRGSSHGATLTTAARHLPGPGVTRK
jgi:hypothetical protein